MFILFDLDDTLIASSASYRDAMAAVGVDITLMKEARRLTKLRVGDGSPSAHSRTLYFKTYLELQNAFNPSASLELTERYERALVEALNKNTDLEDLDRQLSKLKSQGHRLAIITNETLRTQLIKCSVIPNFSSHFDFLLTSEEADAEKPDFKIFRAALERWQVHPNQVTVVGDSGENDLVPARELKMTGIGLTTYRNESADFVEFTWLAKLDELPSALKN